MKKMIITATVLCMLMTLLAVPAFATDTGEQSKVTAAQTGWVVENGRTFYYNKDGNKVTGIKVIDGKKFYFYKSGNSAHKKGQMATGWQQINGNKYYFYQKDTAKHKKGQAAKGWLKFGSKKYYMKSSGIATTGLARISSSRYYFYRTTKNGHKKGQMASGWQTVNDNHYYFSKKTGKAFTGVHKIKKNVYTFNTKGIRTRTVNGSKKMIALTFDDGPSDNTKTILNSLKKNNGLATFFVVGNRVSYYESSVRSASKMGCQIGNHSYTHPWYSNMSASQIKSEISKCNKAARSVTGKTPKVCRTPGGQLGSKITGSVGMPIILWSVDTMDWSTQNSNSTYNSVMNNARDGSVVLMHDLYSATASAAVRIIPDLRKKGYQLVTIQEMALAKGTTLKKGHVYYSF